MPVTACGFESFMLDHKGKFNSRDYDKFECMELVDSSVRDAIHELKTYSHVAVDANINFVAVNNAKTLAK